MHMTNDLKLAIETACKHTHTDRQTHGAMSLTPEMKSVLIEWHHGVVFNVIFSKLSASWCVFFFSYLSLAVLHFR